MPQQTSRQETDIVEFARQQASTVQIPYSKLLSFKLHDRKLVSCKLITKCYLLKYSIQRQPFRGVLKKRCTENMQQFYRRTLMPKCDFNKAAFEIGLWHGCSPVNFLNIFRAHFSKNTSRWLLLSIANCYCGKCKKLYCCLANRNIAYCSLQIA